MSAREPDIEADPFPLDFPKDSRIFCRCLNLRRLQMSRTAASVFGVEGLYPRWVEALEERLGGRSFYSDLRECGRLKFGFFVFSWTMKIILQEELKSVTLLEGL